MTLPKMVQEAPAAYEYIKVSNTSVNMMEADTRTVQIHI